MKLAVLIVVIVDAIVGSYVQSVVGRQEAMHIIVGDACCFVVAVAKQCKEHSVKLCQSVGCTGPYKAAVVLCYAVDGVVGQTLLDAVAAYTVGCSGRQYRNKQHKKYNKISSVLYHNLFLGLGTAKLRKKNVIREGLGKIVLIFICHLQPRLKNRYNKLYICKLRGCR